MNITKTLQVFLLLAIIDRARLLENSEWTEIEFEPAVLQPDLDALSQYFNNIKSDITTAYIHWPHSITFIVRQTEEENEKFLKLEGTFTIPHKTRSSWVYEDGLYCKDNQFYVRSRSKHTLKPIPSSSPIIYSKTLVNLEKPYLSIRYFGLEELFGAITEYNKNHQYHLQWVLRNFPTTFLATLPQYPDGQFLEYALWNIDRLEPKADGGLRALMRSGALMGKFSLTKNTEISNVYFDQMIEDPAKITASTTLKSDDLNTLDTLNKHLFGLRMATVGFLAVVTESSVTLLSSQDLATDSDDGKNKNLISVEELLNKIKCVEPRFNYGDHHTVPSTRLTTAKFQIQGLIFVKSKNLNENKKRDGNCPYVIQHDKEGLNFSIEKENTFQEVQKFCTDDSGLWLPGGSWEFIYNPKKIISLVHKN